QYLFKHFFHTSVCFFMLADASFSGTMAVMTFLSNYLLLCIRAIFGLSPLFLVFSGVAVLFNVANSLLAVHRAVKRGPAPLRATGTAAGGRKKVGVAALYLGIGMDLLVFSFLRIVFFIRGTVSYMMNRTDWDKLNRTDNTYTL
ncbi:MAG: hypothetical protein PHO66_08485, partial [Eubacteriales bacterium]|nr:hypothetical protein [Eubacteriales bacterium]